MKLIPLTTTLLKACMPYASNINSALYAPLLTQTMDRFKIVGYKRQAAFLAQVAHESGSLKYVEEIASGDAYDTRVDLGNTPEVDGDGRKWKGHGLIQVTGFDMHKRCATFFGLDMEQIANWLMTPYGAAMSAGYVWKHVKVLNDLADRGEFLKISTRINGRNKKTGLPNGWVDRVKHWENCKKVLKPFEV